MLFLLACTEDDTAKLDPALAVATLPELDAVAQVTWVSEEAVVGSVRYTVDGVERVATEPEATTTHDVRIVGLPEGAEVELVAWEEAEVGTVTYEQGYGPPELPRVTATGTLDGWILTHTVRNDGDAVVVFDSLGRPVWWRTLAVGERIFDVSIEADGLVWVTTNPGDYVNTEGHVYRFSLDGRSLEEWTIDRVHSGAVPIEDGGFAYVAKQALDHDGGQALYDTIEERAADGSVEVVFDFSTQMPVEALCDHWNLTIMDQPELVYFDWTHANSLVRSEDGTKYLLMLRHYDALIQIDRASGTIDWFLGGPYSDFSFPSPSDMFSHAHTSVVQDGRILMMDNHNHIEPPGARVMEYTFDTTRMAVEVVREHPEENGMAIEYLGDAKDTPDGGLVISWTTLGRIDVVDAAGNVEWRMDSELGAATGRTTLVDSLDPLAVAN